MAYAQWVVIILRNIGITNIKVVNLSLTWGKLYANDNKDSEVSTDSYNNHIVKPFTDMQINSCGRSDASSGTEGSFDLVDVSNNDKLIRHFYWSCPWGEKENTWTISKENDEFLVKAVGANTDSGALGTINVEILKKPVSVDIE